MDSASKNGGANGAIKILQFGEGNFLRAFTDYIVAEMNKCGLFDGRVCVLNLRNTGSVENIKLQKGRYNLISRGIKNGRASVEVSVIDSIAKAVNPYSEFDEFIKFAGSEDLRFVFSNSTEAGICFNSSDKLEDTPPSTFPAKLTLLLFKRYEIFCGDSSRGLIIMPCELLERNGDSLKECVLKYAAHWNLPRAFSSWVEQNCAFCNTLVDRIVSGFPKDFDGNLMIDGKPDRLAVVAEPYYLWAIEAPECVKKEMPFEKSALNAVYTSDISGYRARKVTFLNAPHTLISAIGLQLGLSTVCEAVEHQLLSRYLDALMFGELLKTLDFPSDELRSYGMSVIERFKNPYLQHSLKSIASNIESKCAVRVAPPVKRYVERGNGVPHAACLGLAANFTYLFSEGGNKKDSDIGAFSEDLLSKIFEGNRDFDGYDSVCAAVLKYVNMIAKNGILNALEDFLNEGFYKNR